MTATIHRFRNSTTKTQDFSKVLELEPQPLELTSEGMNDREAEIAIKKNNNKANEARVLRSEYSLHKELNLTYAEQLNVVQSALDIGIAELGIEQKKLGYQTAQVGVDIARIDFDLAGLNRDLKQAELSFTQAKVPLVLSGMEAEFATLQAQVQTRELQSQITIADFEHLTAIGDLNGYKTQLSLPEFKRPDFSFWRERVTQGSPALEAEAESVIA